MKKRLVSLIIASLVISTATPAFAAETTESAVAAETEDSGDENTSNETDTPTEESDNTDEDINVTADGITTTDTDEQADEMSDNNEIADTDISSSSENVAETNETTEETTLTSDDCTHQWGDWERNPDVTYCKDDGEIRTCSNCGETETRGAAHKFSAKLDVVTKASLTDQGVVHIDNICDYCKAYETKKRTYIAKIESVELTKDSYQYTGENCTPDVMVVNRVEKVLSDEYYDVEYPANRSALGTYKVKITFKGKYYTGSVTKTFSIVPQKTDITKLSSSYTTLTAKWNKKTDNIDGYQIQYSKYKDFSNAYNVMVKKNATTSKKITGLSKGTKYYIRIRTYKKENGKTYYSNWSSSTSKKTKGTGKTVDQSKCKARYKLVKEWAWKNHKAFSDKFYILDATCLVCGYEWTQNGIIYQSFDSAHDDSLEHTSLKDGSPCYGEGDDEDNKYYSSNYKFHYTGDEIHYQGYGYWHIYLKKI